MKLDNFFENFKEVLEDLADPDNQKAFSENMNRLGRINMGFSEWVGVYLAWSELASEEDIKRYYWHLEEEENE